MTYLWGEVVDADDEVAAILGATDKRNDAVLVVVAVDPLEPIPVKVDLPERLVVDIEFIERLRVGEHLRMHRVLLDEVPVHAVVKVPLDEVPELTAHEEQLLARMCDPVAEETAQTREFLPIVARHLADERALSMHDFVV